MRIISTILLFFILLPAKSQINVGAWRDHLPYQSCRKVAKIGTKVYCSTDFNVFTYNTHDNSLQKLSKITGLSDIGVSNMGYNETNNILLIAYTDGNIDLIKNNQITNIPDIYRQSIPGSKKANNIFFIQNIAYISYSFGIVVLDLDKNEIKDTYVVGENGTNYEVLSLVADDKYFYAATEKGIFKADINDQFLVNYSHWIRDNTIPNSSGNFDALGVFNNTVIANYSGSGSKNDTLYACINQNWQRILPGENYNHYEIRQCGTQLVVTGKSRVYILNATFGLVSTIDNYGFDAANPYSAMIDDSGNTWIADGSYGLVMKPSGNSNFTSIYPNGPTSNHAGQMQFLNGILSVTGGGTTSSMAPLYFVGQLFQFSDENWKSFTNWDAFDYTTVTLDPSDPQKVYVGSWGGGVYVYQNGQITDHYTDKNSTLRTNIPGSSSFCIGGITIDANKNLWIAQGGVNAPISIRKPNGDWLSLSWNSYLGTFALGEIYIDPNNQFWVPLLPNHGLFVFNPNNTLTNEKDDSLKIIKPVDLYGDIVDRVLCVTGDRNGYVWIGTDHGPFCYTSPQDIFNGQTKGTQIEIPRNDGKGTIDPLLGTETINCITVDGANRKWFGTVNGGAFLFSPDGTRQIYHFNTDNSPIFSNNILSIGVNENSGEVFFGTTNGIISFRASATKPNEDFTNVYVYPDPVRENYEGVITITGLIENTTVKITDISGNLVYQTKSLGGQATWNGKGHGGRRVATGVYLVFCSNDDGSKTFVTKMLVIH